ncbi:MAG TPA: glycosidase [Clostridiaceae bacterium]
MKTYTPTLLNSRDESYPELFKRSLKNPIITSKDLPYPAHTIFNPAATIFENNTLLLARVEDRRGFSHLAKAISKDGISNWMFDKIPTVQSEPDIHIEERWGIEDPRITWMEELSKWAVVYTAFSRAGPQVSLALTSDFINFEKHGSIMPPDDKDAALFPRKFNGKYMLIHRPCSGGRKAHIWISSSTDLKSWGDHQILLNARNGGWWDANKIGLSAQPLETTEGWLILYHGVKFTAAGAIYRLGLALLDLDNPLKVLKRSNEWIFGPETPYEKFGDISDVVFPCGWILNDSTGIVNMYYGGADSCICLANASLSELLQYINNCPKPNEDDLKQSDIG